jgi:exodeoxyribonuclease VII large subunit
VLIDQRLLANTGLREQIYRQVESRINLATAQVQGVQSTLRALSPQGTLDRGYAIVRNEHGAVVKSKDVIKTGEILSIKIAQGTVTVEVTQSE